MKIKEAIAIIENEIECVKRANICDRNCGNCELVKTDNEILESYNIAIAFLKLFREEDLQILRKCGII